MLQEAHRFFKLSMQNVQEFEKNKKRKKQIRNFSIKFNQPERLLNRMIFKVFCIENIFLQRN